ncbi:MAG: hypothetical protein LBP55_05380 [Candidatus Adiutrix sp.]|jgi:hypothetical protein|nr:hypothetical protein [Candidatus Adiutrix sp.]
MIILTIDTDWAPEEATGAVLEKVRALGVKVTVFFSTPSAVTEAPWPLLEIGCHPDLSRRQGQSQPDGGLAMATLADDAAVDAAESGILSDYRSAFPRARAIRTHRFYWHSDLSRNLVKNGFVHDSSMIMPFHPGLQGFKVGKLTRWPVWSSDHLHLARHLPLDRLALPNLESPGLKIFCFHVAYLHLNVASLSEFNMVKTRLADGRGREPVASGPGVWDLFEKLAARVLEESPGRWLSEIPPEFIVKGPSA